MIGRYALYSDDQILAKLPTMTASAEDPDYPVGNWYAFNPAHPAKLTSGAAGNWFEFDMLAPTEVAAFGLIYSNITTGSFTIQANSSSSWGSPAFQQTITVPAAWEDGYRPSPWAPLTGGPQTYRYWRWVSVGTNVDPISIGRPAFLGALRDTENDVRWGVVEEGQHRVIDAVTEGDVEIVTDIYAPRRGFTGELAVQDATASLLLSLFRSAHNRARPWYLIPDVSVSDLWVVRFTDTNWSRTREAPDHNIFPFRVRELSRGLPWP